MGNRAAYANQDIKIDMWHGDKFEPGKFRADAVFYPHGSFGYCYRGNIYNDAGEIIGDYAANDSTVIQEHFVIDFGE